MIDMLLYGAMQAGCKIEHTSNARLLHPQRPATPLLSRAIGVGPDQESSTSGVYATPSVLLNAVQTVRRLGTTAGFIQAPG
jgi:hypothetical protein